MFFCLVFVFARMNFKQGAWGALVYHSFAQALPFLVDILVTNRLVGHQDAIPALLSEWVLVILNY